MTIGDRQAWLAGAPGDPFWQAQKGFDSRHFPMARCIGRYLPEDAITLDVSANIGLVTLVLVMRCSAGHVFAVEPVPENVRYLRRNLALDEIGNLSPATQRSYLHAVAKFSRYCGRSPDRLGFDEVRAYQLHLIGEKRSWPPVDQTVCAWRFFFGVTLGRTDAVGRIVMAREPQRLPGCRRDCPNFCV